MFLIVNKFYILSQFRKINEKKIQSSAFLFSWLKLELTVC